MIRQLPESKKPLKEMPAKVTDMTAIIMPARTIRTSKEHALLEVADITTCPGIRHKLNHNNSKVPGTWCNNMVKASRDIEMMMGILPLRGRDISNPNSSISSSSRTCFRFQLPRGCNLGL
jgi:hypothetical protein